MTADSGNVNTDSGNTCKSVTLKRNHCSRSSGIGVHDQPKWAFTFARNTQLDFIKEATNIILVGPNGVGKSMIAQNIAHHAVMQGHSALFINAALMLGDLAAQDGDNALRRRLKHYAHPDVLVIDEIGYLSYSNRHADLLFNIVNRRYELKPTILTTNRPFAEWSEVFPNAACVVSIVDRLVHHSEILVIKGESYRMREAKERAARKKSAVKPRRKPAKHTSPKQPT